MLKTYAKKPTMKNFKCLMNFNLDHIIYFRKIISYQPLSKQDITANELGKDL